MATLAARVAALAAAIRDKLNTITPMLVPPGGDTGQVLAKTSGADHALAWADAGGGWQEIASVTPGAVNAVDFTSIPQIFSDLQITYDGMSHNSGSSQTFTIAVSNGVTFSGSVNISGSFAASALFRGSTDILNYRGDAGSLRTGMADISSSSPAAGTGSNSSPAWYCSGGIKGLRIGISGGATFDAGSIRLQGR